MNERGERKVEKEVLKAVKKYDTLSFKALTRTTENNK